MEKNVNQKVSFDFDGTLEMKSVQEYAAELMWKQVEVFVTTSRFGDPEKYKKFFHTTTSVDVTNNDLYEITDNLGIPCENITFTNMEDKWKYVEEKGFRFHLDDDWIENEMINERRATKGIDFFGNPDWKEKCEKALL